MQFDETPRELVATLSVREEEIASSCHSSPNPRAHAAAFGTLRGLVQTFARYHDHAMRKVEQQIAELQEEVDYLRGLSDV